jgi:serine/threonine protein kinase
LKPETSVSGGFVTSFIDVCHCKSARFQQQEEQVNPFSMCGNCHKAIPGKERHGSLTQWIFRFDSCTCEEPRPLHPIRQGADAAGSSGKHDSGDLAPDDRTVERQEPELTVKSEQFPLERYKPIAILGKGASGVVYLARDRFLKKKVALKVLNHLDGEQLMAFQEEAKLTSKLDHPNIIRVLDFGPTPSGIPYMVLDFSDRVLSLAHSLKENGPLDVSTAIEVFSKIADALAYAHSAHVFHRDLKSSNILFTYAEHEAVIVKLIDFGVATLRQENLEPTVPDTTTVVGTLGYMAPEIAGGTSYDVLCEIYSLGCVLYEALTGRLPFISDSPVAMLNRHLNEQPEPLSVVAGKPFPALMEKLVLQCLSKNREERPASMLEFKRILQRAYGENDTEVDQTGAGEISTGAGSSSRPRVARRMSAMLLSCVILGAIATAVAMAIKNQMRSNAVNSASIAESASKEKPHLQLEPELEQKRAGEALADGDLGASSSRALGDQVYKLAMELKNPDAMLALGDLYRDGRGVSRDARLAESYYRQAALLGNTKARERLGLHSSFFSGLNARDRRPDCGCKTC